MDRFLAPCLLVVVASASIAAHAQPRPVAKPNAPVAAPATPPMRVRVPAPFAHVVGESTTVNGHTVKKSDLLAQIDPARVVTLPNGKSMTVQQLFDGVGRSEDKARRANTSLHAIPTRSTAMVNPGPRIALQKQKIAAAKARLVAAKASGWASGMVEHPAAGPPPPPDVPFASKSNAPPSRKSGVRRMVSPCAFAPGHAPNCVPEFASIEAPPWSQDVGDRNVVGGSTSFSISSSTSADGEQSTCSLEWDNVGQVFGTSWDVLKVSGAETSNAKSGTFSGALAIYVAGAAINVPGDASEGADGTLMDETYHVSAGGKIPLVGPIYLELKLDASASMSVALVGERRLVAGDPNAVPGAPPGATSGTSTAMARNPSTPSMAVGIARETHGTHCHVGVEPKVDSDVQLTTGIGFGIDDLVDLMHIAVTGEVKPIVASLPTHVTLDLQRAPPTGQVAFDAHLNARFMQSQLSFDWTIFDVCWNSPVGSVCLLRDILQIPTSGSVVIAQDEGFDPLDVDLAGGGRTIRWKPK